MSAQPTPSIEATDKSHANGKAKKMPEMSLANGPQAPLAVTMEPVSVTDLIVDEKEIDGYRAHKKELQESIKGAIDRVMGQYGEVLNYTADDKSRALKLQKVKDEAIENNYFPVLSQPVRANTSLNTKIYTELSTDSRKALEAILLDVIKQDHKAVIKRAESVEVSHAEAKRDLARAQAVFSDGMNLAEKFYDLNHTHDKEFLKRIEAYITSTSSKLTDVVNTGNMSIDKKVETVFGVLETSIAGFKNYFENTTVGQDRQLIEQTQALLTRIDALSSDLTKQQMVQYTSLTAAVLAGTDFNKESFNKVNGILETLQIGVDQIAKQKEQLLTDQNAEIVQLTGKNTVLDQENKSLSAWKTTNAARIEFISDKRHPMFRALLGKQELSTLVMTEYRNGQIHSMPKSTVEGMTPLDQYVESLRQFLGGSNVLFQSTIYCFSGMKHIDVGDAGQNEVVNGLLAKEEDVSVNYICVARNNDGGLFYRPDSNSHIFSLLKQHDRMKDAKSVLNGVPKQVVGESGNAHLRDPIVAIGGALLTNHSLLLEQSVKLESSQMKYATMLRSPDTYLIWLSTKEPRYKSGVIHTDSNVVLT
jgi:hypothetical protein